MLKTPNVNLPGIYWKEYFSYVVNEGITVEPNIRCQVELFCSLGSLKLKCTDSLSDNTIDSGPVLIWCEDPLGSLIPRVSDRQTTESSRCFWNWRFHLYVHTCHLVRDTHIVTETYAFLHIPPVLANCRQSLWGNSGVLGKSCLMCRLEV